MLDIVIPHLNCPLLEKCVSSLVTNTPNGVIDSITLINQSGTTKNIPNVDLEILCRDQVGFARASNIGIAIGSAPYVMVLNDDCVFLDRRWWYGILKTFNLYRDLLCVNPSSPLNPGQECKYKTPADVTPKEYETLLNTRILDGICMWAPVFKRDIINKIQGSSQSKLFDELFWPGGGEDYDLNRRAYMSKYRCVGTNLSWVWHWWHGTSINNKLECKYDGGLFKNKWSLEGEDPSLFGENGLQIVPINKLLKG